jgi:antitoxin MazE6
MRITISIPDDVFANADRLARRLGMSRSLLYSEALREYAMRRLGPVMTKTLNRLCDELSGTDHAFAIAASRRCLRRASW